MHLVIRIFMGARSALHDFHNLEHGASAVIRHDELTAIQKNKVMWVVDVCARAYCRLLLHCLLPA
jgi:hypothetical protein